jgi:hypothetical protein
VNPGGTLRSPIGATAGVCSAAGACPDPVSDTNVMTNTAATTMASSAATGEFRFNTARILSLNSLNGTEVVQDGGARAITILVGPLQVWRPFALSKRAAVKNLP